MTSKKITAFLLIFTLFPLVLCAQQKEKSYELLPAPDLWYNDVDGIRVGLRLKGQTPGSFDDGPHRLDLGIWVGTWLPEFPFSYYLSFTEPIPAISDFGSEGNIQLLSSIRTGFQQHGLSFNKRWQTGFNEENYKELSIGFRTEDRFAGEYLLYPQLWQNNWLYLATVGFMYQQDNGPGLFRLGTSANINLAGSNAPFIQSSAEIEQLITLDNHFSVRGRLFSGVASKEAATQYLFSNSMMPAIGWMNKGLTRAKGTIPTNWMSEGIFQVSGGANLRGYLNQDFRSMNAGLAPVYTSIAALNIEVDYPNPLNSALQKIPMLGSLLKLRSYLFFDSGTSLGLTPVEDDRLLSDAGLGFMFTLNIPDYLGKPRGIMIRYDIPLWLSHPGVNPHFDYRNLIGIGAVISL